MRLKNQHIAIGISGGIAAYKIPQLIRLCVKEGAEVKVITTPSALHFVTPLTLQTLSQNNVYQDIFQPYDSSTEHIQMAQWADILVVAPATANTIAKMANGIADNALTSIYLAFNKKVIIAPAMNHNMLHHPATRHNLDTLAAREKHVVLPTDFGQLACLTEGDGRMMEPEMIVQQIIMQSKEQDLEGEKILITAGPTQERIDPVRYITNNSSGKMGYALAEECASRGADVTLVSGPTNLKLHHPHITIKHVVSAQEMYDAVETYHKEQDICIFCAAVADYTPLEPQCQKIKTHCASELRLVPTKDIAAEMGKQKQNGQLHIGFALETNDEEINAKEKLKKKNLDLIVLNSLNNPQAGYQYDTNQITIFGKNNYRKDFPLKDKKEVAADIIDEIKKLTKK